MIVTRILIRVKNKCYFSHQAVGYSPLHPTDHTKQGFFFTVTYELLNFDTAPSLPAQKLLISPLNSVHVYCDIYKGRTVQ
jgi:hypothetical protein